MSTSESASGASYFLRLAVLEDEWRRVASLHLNADVFFGVQFIGRRVPDDEFFRLREEHEFDCLRDVADVENQLFDLEQLKAAGWFDAEVRVHSRVLERRDRVAKLKAVGAWYNRPTELEFGWRYSVDAGRELRTCCYCGAGARGWDHVPALAVVARMAEAERDATDCRVVRCCAPCNARLAFRDLRTVEERRAYLQAPRVRGARASAEAGDGS